MEKSDKIITIGIIIVGLLVVFGDDIANLGDIDILPEEEVKLLPADVQLFQFNDLVSNETVNVELWIKNIGEQTATDIEIFLRVRDHNGTVMYVDTIPITALILREDETSSGIYVVHYDDEEYLIHTIEISWTTGRNSYSKTTVLI